MSSGEIRKIAEFAREMHNDRNIARRLALGLLDKWGISGLERSIAVARIERSIRESSDLTITSTLDWIEKVMRERH